MTLFLVVARELRVAARHGRNYWLRATAAALAMALGGLVASSMHPSRPSVRAEAVFFTLGWLAWFYCILAGVWLSADAISSERRGGTLGLLFLTDLKGYEVVLGKLAASSVSAVYGLLAMAPVLAIPILMGGVGWDQVVKQFLTLGATLTFSLAIGMFVSCWFTSGRWATGVTFLVIAAITLVPWLILFLDASGRRLATQPNWTLALPSPLFAQALVGSPSGPGKPSGFFWPGLAWIAGWVVLFLGGACLALARVWRGLPRWLTALPVARSWADSPERARRRRRLMEMAPFFWLASPRPRIWPRELLLFVVLAVCWGAWTAEMELGLDDGWLVFSSVLVHTLLKIRVAFAASRLLGEEAESGRMELLLTTPLKERDFVVGTLLAVARWAVPWIGVLLGLDLCMLLWLVPVIGLPGDLEYYWSFMTFHMVALPIEAVALAAVAMRAAVRRRRSVAAGFEAIGLVVVFPIAALVVGELVLEMFPLFSLHQISGTDLLMLLYAGSDAWAGCLAVWAFVDLHRRLRKTVSEPAGRRRLLWPWSGAGEVV